MHPSRVLARNRGSSIYSRPVLAIVILARWVAQRNSARRAGSCRPRKVCRRSRRLNSKIPCLPRRGTTTVNGMGKYALLALQAAVPPPAVSMGGASAGACPWTCCRGAWRSKGHTYHLSNRQVVTLPDRQAAVARRLPRCVVWVPADVTAHVGVAQRAGRAPSRACDGGRAAGDQAGTGAS